MYSNGREGDENKWSYNQHYYGAGLTYGNGPLNFDLIYEALDYKGKEDKNKTTQLLNLGASYDFGAFKLYGAYEYAIHAPLPGFVGFDTKTEAGKNWKTSTTMERPTITTPLLCLLPLTL